MQIGAEASTCDKSYRRRCACLVGQTAARTAGACVQVLVPVQARQTNGRTRTWTRAWAGNMTNGEREWPGLVRPERTINVIEWNLHWPVFSSFSDGREDA